MRWQKTWIGEGWIGKFLLEVFDWETFWLVRISYVSHDTNGFLQCKYHDIWKYSIHPVAIKFSHLCDYLCSCSLAVVRKNPLTSKASESDVESVMKKWLQLAAYREGGRRRRDRSVVAPVPWWTWGEVYLSDNAQKAVVWRTYWHSSRASKPCQYIIQTLALRALSL